MEFDLPKLAPSILAADFTVLGEQIHDCEKGGAQWIHCDIMDGHFVPNISYGADIVAAVHRSAPDLFFDVHLMIEDPDRYIESFANAGADLITVHQEACPHLHRTIHLIRDHGCMAGVAINPATAVSLLEPILNDLDLVLVMSVNPGFGGQSFIESTLTKLEELRRLREASKSSWLLEVDGGVGEGTIERVVRAGADILVAGSSVFRSENITGRVQTLQAMATRATEEN
ncbi:MAG: ribulose-phosphate 3-epimerase [Bacteroidota bacterium]